MKSGQVLPQIKEKKPKSALPLIRTPQTEIRMAVPGMNKNDVSSKYWDMASRQTEAILGNQVPQKSSRRPMTAFPVQQSNAKGFLRASEDPIISSETPLETFEERLKEEARSRAGPLQPKPFSFLSKLGGNITHAESLVKADQGEILGQQMASLPELPKVSTLPAYGPRVVNEEIELDQERKQLLTIFTNYDVDDYTKKKLPSRLVSAQTRTKGELDKASRPISSYQKPNQHKIGSKMQKIEGSKRPFSAFPKYIFPYKIT